MTRELATLGLTAALRWSSCKGSKCVDSGGPRVGVSILCNHVCLSGMHKCERAASTKKIEGRTARMNFVAWVPRCGVGSVLFSFDSLRSWMNLRYKQCVHRIDLIPSCKISHVSACHKLQKKTAIISKELPPLQCRHARRQLIMWATLLDQTPLLSARQGLQCQMNTNKDVCYGMRLLCPQTIHIETLLVISSVFNTTGRAYVSVLRKKRIFTLTSCMKVCGSLFLIGHLYPSGLLYGKVCITEWTLCPQTTDTTNTIKRAMWSLGENGNLHFDLF